MNNINTISNSIEEAYSQFAVILSNAYSYEVTCGFVGSLQRIPLSQQLVTGFQRAMMDHALPVKTHIERSIDICGTGGDGKNTINISTLTALTVASCGYYVTKHGNTSFSSTCGSSDILLALGIPLPKTQVQIEKQLQQCGITFLHAPYFHPLMKHIGAIRKKINTNTIFNILGPLCNPIQTCVSMLGVADYSTYLAYKAFLDSSDREYAVIWDEAGYDEISLTARTFVHTHSRDFILDTSDFIPEPISHFDLLQGDTMDNNKSIFLGICRGEGTLAQVQVIAANAALALCLLETTMSIQDAFSFALAVIKKGCLYTTLKKLIETSI